MTRPGIRSPLRRAATSMSIGKTPPRSGRVIVPTMLSGPVNEMLPSAMSDLDGDEDQRDRRRPGPGSRGAAIASRRPAAVPADIDGTSSAIWLNRPSDR